MDPEKAAVVIRPRTHGESLDLGTRMLQHWAWPVYQVWFLVTIPLFFVSFYFLSTLTAVLLWWWFLPILDRLPLFVVSRALFGATPSLGETIKALPRLLSRSFLFAITLGRLDSTRSYWMPVGELEGLRGRAFLRRSAVLRSQGGLHGFLLGVLSFALLLVFLSGLSWGLEFLLPEGMRDGEGMEHWFEMLGNEQSWKAAVIFYISLSLVEPFYVIAGFALYLNRRTELEGWDVELVFRRLARRLRKVAGVAVLLLCCSSLPAQESPQQPDEVIQETLQSRDFGYEEKAWEWRRIHDPEPDDNSRDHGNFRFGGGAGLVSNLLYLLLWGVGIAGLLFLLWSVFKKGSNVAGSGGTKVKPATVRGLDVRPDELPADLAAHAWALWQDGNPAACLSLLYRGALAHLIHVQSLPIVESSTEGDCLRLVLGLEEAESGPYFGALTRHWQACAYAHRLPTPLQAREMCDGWPKYFGGRA